jgi:predicted lipoprotein with Yx(FWY)xxD motif
MRAGIPRGAPWVAGVCAALLAAARFYPHTGAVVGTAWPVALATPPGITLQLRAGAEKTRVAAAAEWVYADSRGRSFYTYDADARRGTSACSGACAAVWPAALAPPTAAAEGNWSLREHGGGHRQWVLRGAPLYTFSNDAAIGDVAGDGADDGAWHVAAFRPDAGIALPDGIAVREIADAGGAGLVETSGLTLYAFEGNAAHPKCDGEECTRLWLPLEAPAIANSVGDFSPLARDDGITQWMYRGKPLYKFAADRNPQDANGSGVDSRFRVALVLRFFLPADATIRRTLELGDILASRSGATLYQRDRVTSEELHQFRADHGSPALGRWFGTASCDAQCTKSWPPFSAPAEALPGGYWDIVARADGTRQWVYKGFALYTYVADRPGAINGNAIYDLQQIGSMERGVDPNGSMRAAAPGVGLGAMFWHAVVP